MAVRQPPPVKFPSGPIQGPAYLPSHLMGGNTAGSSAAGFPSPVGKTRTVQNLGNITGHRTAGMTNLAGPQAQMSHAFDNYGKARESGLSGGGDLSGGDLG